MATNFKKWKFKPTVADFRQLSTSRSSAHEQSRIWVLFGAKPRIPMSNANNRNNRNKWKPLSPQYRTKGQILQKETHMGCTCFDILQKTSQVVNKLHRPERTWGDWGSRSEVHSDLHRRIGKLGGKCTAGKPTVSRSQCAQRPKSNRSNSSRHSTRRRQDQLRQRCRSPGVGGCAEPALPGSLGVAAGVFVCWLSVRGSTHPHIPKNQVPAATEPDDRILGLWAAHCYGKCKPAANQETLW